MLLIRKPPRRAQKAQHIPNAQPADFPKENSPPGLNRGPDKKRPAGLCQAGQLGRKPGY